MKNIILLTIATYLFAQTEFVDGLERGSSEYKRDACNIAKAEARKNYDVKDMDVGCNCEKSDSREWMCFVKFKHMPKSQR